MVSRGGSLLLENTPSFARWNPTEQSLVRVVCGFVAGMALGLSEPVWRKAVIADHLLADPSALHNAGMSADAMDRRARPKKMPCTAGFLFLACC